MTRTTRRRGEEGVENMMGRMNNERQRRERQRRADGGLVRWMNVLGRELRAGTTCRIAQSGQLKVVVGELTGGASGAFHHALGRIAPTLLIRERCSHRRLNPPSPC